MYLLTYRFEHVRNTSQVKRAMINAKQYYNNTRIPLDCAIFCAIWSRHSPT